MDKAQKQKILDELGGIPEEIYDKLVVKLFEQIMDTLPKIKEALGLQDHEAVKRLAHSIKGSAGNLRISYIHLKAKELEFSAIEKKDFGLIAQQLDQLKEVF